MQPAEAMTVQQLTPLFRSLAGAIFIILALAACSGSSSEPPAMRVGFSPVQYAVPGSDVPSAVPVRSPQLESASSSSRFAMRSAPPIRAASYLLIDANTGKRLASRIPESVRAVASTQKLVTALVVLDAGNLDRTVTVQSSDLRVEPSVLGVKAGERYTRRDLLYAFLVKSSNDVANILARDNAGSIPAFAAKMNAKMRSLGARQSNFKNPHGLTEPGQYSTAADMARVAMVAYRNRIIRDAIRRKTYTFRYNSGKVITLQNTNKVLGRMAECNGMKTGYTRASGRCLISTASRGSRDVILVQLGTQTKYIWDDAQTLMSWGLSQTSSRGFAMNW
jgi:D-alanyl-D-alanine carboxypeptidase (penicillin-binding protein 5/6)